MGGNVKVGNYEADKIDFTKVDYDQFKKDVYILFKLINNLYEEKYKKKLWNDNVLQTAIVFNGSSSFMLHPETTKDITTLKPKMGDIDIMVPENEAENLWNLLKELENKKIGNFVYLGNSKNNFKSIGDQINTLFEYNGVNVQVDFELVGFINDVPSEWARFSHSSSFEDLKNNIKAVFHKYLLRSISYAVSIKPNAIFVTSTANCDNWEKKTTKSSKDNHILKFSVSKGLRIAYVPLECNGHVVEKDGKIVLRKLKTEESIYITDLRKVFDALFGVEPSKEDLKNFWSAYGLTKLIKKYLNKQQREILAKRFLDLLWQNENGRIIAQQIEMKDPQADYNVKIAAINTLSKLLPEIKKEYQKYKNSGKIDKYYELFIEKISKMED